VQRKRTALFLITTLSISLVSSVSTSWAQSAKPGSGCTVKGKTVTLKSSSSSQVLICQKNSSGRLTWQVKKSVKKNTKTEVFEKSTPIAPDNSKNPTKQIRKSVSLAEKDLSDLDLVAHLAALVNYSETNVIKTKRIFGPNTSSSNGAKYLTSLDFAAKLFAKYWDPKQEITIALAEFRDFDWMRNYWVTFKDDKEHIEMMTNQWQVIGRNCNQGGAIFKENAFFWGCLPPDTPNLDSIGIMKFAPHEFFHLIQTDVFRKNGGQFSDMPTFFNEGAADFFGISAAIGKGDATVGWKQKWTYGWASGVSNATLKTFSAERWRELLNDSTGKYSDLVGHNYYSGAYGVQRLIAAEGVDTYFKFMGDSAKIHDWKTAFKNNYGITFEDFSTQISLELVEKAKLLQ